MPTVTNIGLTPPGVGTLVLLDERFGLQRAAGKLIETDLHPPHLDGVTAPMDRG